MTCIPAVVVDTHGALQASGGGVQMCNREYLQMLMAAGFAIKKVPFHLDRRLWPRIANRLFPKLRPAAMPPELAPTVYRAINETQARFVFYGLTRYAGLARQLRQCFPGIKQVLLSHGTEAVDFVIEQQIRRRMGAQSHSPGRAAKMLGEEIFQERELRRFIDAALVLSPFEAELEKWLGTPVAQWVPRSVMEPALEARPINGRVGCVLTLDHPPNHDGLVQLFDELTGKAPTDFRFRIVGRPDHLGRDLQTRHSFVEYLGGLDDAALRAEAIHWCCFVHSLFVNAKGCSTKLAIGLGWGLPVATTQLGARGYQWDDGILPLAKTPAELAAAVIARSRSETFRSFQKQTLAIIAQTPALMKIAESVRDLLLKI